MSDTSVPVEKFDRLWNYGDPAGTAEKFEALIPEATAEGADLHAQLLTQIARTHGLRRDFESAHRRLDEAASLIGGAEGPPTVARVRLSLERGRAYNSSGESKKSIAFFEQALSDATTLLEEQPTAEFHQVDAAHMLGIVCEPDAALEWNEKAIALAELAKDVRARGWLGALYNNTGWTHHDAGRFDRALELFEKGLSFRQEMGQAQEARIAKWTIARTHRSMGQFALALSEQGSLRTEYEAADVEVSPFVWEELGECLWALDRVDDARPYFERAVPGLEAQGWVEAERIAEAKRRAKPEHDSLGS